MGITDPQTVRHISKLPRKHTLCNDLKSRDTEREFLFSIWTWIGTIDILTLLSLALTKGIQPLTPLWALPLTAVSKGHAEPVCSAGTWQVPFWKCTGVRSATELEAQIVCNNLSCVVWLGITQKSFRGYTLHLELNLNSLWLPANPCMLHSGCFFGLHRPHTLSSLTTGRLLASCQLLRGLPGSWNALPFWNAPCLLYVCLIFIPWVSVYFSFWIGHFWPPF